ncbi:hypothetical protein STCU_04898 [Strigomonas culicis]|nr:hypothetical protein STCU_04898 [Strigomonas culicis]|eukprot:EPY28753.1 hypothetical protein STCU_04898 [Strigomonas culicis]
MARCLCARLGAIAAMSEEVVLQKQSGLRVNCEALVDFERAKAVRCQLAWVARLPSVAKSAAVSDAALWQRVEAGPPLFHVTSFHIAPQAPDVFDVLQYVDLEDFEPFVEEFVLHLVLCRPLAAAVAVMHESLRAHYAEAAAQAELEQKMRRAVQVCGGLRDPTGDATLKEKRVVRRAAAAATEGGGAEGKTSEVEAIEMVYVLEGRTRNLEVEVRVIFAGLQCYVIRYNVTLQADTRTQVVLDGETGGTTLVA